MKKIIATSVMALALATSASAEMNVGIGLNLGDVLNGNSVSVRVPLDLVGKGIRIEPELGFSRTSYSSTVDYTSSSYTIACGGYYNLWTVDKMNIYAGGRLAIERVAQDNAFDEFNENTTGFGIQGLFGAEYLMTDKFTVAAQAGIELGFGSDISTFATVGHVVVRYFFLPSN